MSTRSRPYGPVAEAEAALERGGSAWLAGLLALVFGLVLWAIGAKYSIDGWVIGLNIAFAQLDLPARLPAPVGWQNLLFIPLGIAYSYVELRIRVPWRGVPLQTTVAIATLLALTHASDVGSTYLAAVSLPPGAWPIAVWAATQMWPAALWSVALTYLPESLMMWGIRQVWPRS